MKKNVLLVEDDPGIREVFKIILDVPELEVFEAASCDEAYKRLEEIRFDVVLLDNKLPDGTGLYLLPVALHHCPHVIMVTADADRIRTAALSCGAKAVFDKSVDPDELLRECLSSA